MKISRYFYVYIWFRPWDGSPCWVGKGTGERWREKGRYNSPHLKNIIRKCGGVPPAVIVRDGLTESQAFETERALIAVIGRSDRGLGPLVNHTDGGEGCAGMVHSDGAKRKMTAARKAAFQRSPEILAASIASLWAAKEDPEIMSRAKEAHTEAMASEEVRAKLSRSLAAHYAKPAAIHPMLGKSHSAESIAKMSAKRKALYAAGMPHPRSGIRHSKASLAKMKASHAGTTHSRETRAKMSASAKAAWVVRANASIER